MKKAISDLHRVVDHQAEAVLREAGRNQDNICIKNISGTI